MSTDNAQLLTQVATETIDVLRAEQPAFDDQVATIMPVEAVNGSFPFFAAAAVLGKDLGSKAIGTDPTPIDWDISSVDYKLERYSHSCTLDQAEIKDLNQYDNALSKAAIIPMRYNQISRESDLAVVLTDAAENGQQAAAAGTWNLSTSTPVADILNLQQDFVPEGDMAVIGYTSAKELRVHPDIKERLGSGFAAGGAVTFDELKAVIAGILGIAPNEVHIWKTFENAAKFGQTVSLSRVVSDFFWFGEKAGILKVAQTGEQDSVTVETNHKKITTAVSDTVQFKRVEVLSGGEVINL